MTFFDKQFLGFAVVTSLLASTAIANDAHSTIEQLPEKGPVTLSGTVSKIEDKDTFILKDSAGKTIDIHTSAEISVQVGQNVTVSGEMEDEALGLGREITKASVHTNAQMSDSSAKSESSTHATTSATTGENTTKVETEEKPVPSYDVDVDVKENAEGETTGVDVDLKKTKEKEASDY